MISDYYVNLHFNQAIAHRTGYAFKIGDKGCTFHFHCEDLDPSGMLPHIVFNHPNNTCVEGVPTGSGRDYAYTIQGNEFAVIGKTVVDLKFYDALDATQRISTASFIIEILPDTYTDFLAPSSPYADSLETAKEELEDAEQDLTDMDALFAQTLQDYIDAFGNTAPINPRGEYDPLETYYPRDAVYYTSGGKTLTYLNNLECTGVDPTNTSNWQPIIDITGIPAIIDNCTSTSTTDALSANQGRVIADNLAANEESGAKNKLPYPYYQTTKTVNDITFTDVGDGPITVSGVASGGATFYLTNNYTGTPLKQGAYKVNGCPINGGATSYRITIEVYDTLGQTVSTHYDDGAGVEVPVAENQSLHLSINVYSGVDLSTPITFKPMIYDARILAPTYAPPAKTNVQLTQDKAERKDLTTIFATGNTNTTGSQINANAFFYLNGVYCKALQNIGTGNSFAKNTNYKEDSVGKVIQEEDISLQITVNTTYFNSSALLAYEKMCNGLKWLNIYGQPISTVPHDTAFMSGFTPNAIHKLCPVYNYGSQTTRFVRIWVNGSGQLMVDDNLSTDDVLVYNDIIR